MLLGTGTRQHPKPIRTRLRDHRKRYNMNPGRGTVSGCLYRANFENSCKISGFSSQIWSSTHGRPQPPRIASLWAPVTIPKRSGETCDCAACLLLFPGAQTRSGEILVNSCNSCNFENCLIPRCSRTLPRAIALECSYRLGNDLG